MAISDKNHKKYDAKMKKKRNRCKNPPLKFKLRMAQNVVYLSKNSVMKSFVFLKY